MSETKTESLTCRACGYSVDTAKTVDKPNDVLITCPGCKGVAALAAFRTQESVKANATPKPSVFEDVVKITVGLTAVLLVFVSTLAIIFGFMKFFDRDPLIRDGGLHDIYLLVRNIAIYIHLILFGKLFYWSITTLRSFAK